MPREISCEIKQLIKRLYAQDLSIREISKRVNVSRSTVYGYTKLRQRIDPETGKLFESRSQLQDYQARQRIDPETGKLFESQSQYIDYRARQRINRSENQVLSDLIKRRLKELGKNQSWLSRQIGVSREAVSKYFQGKYIPNNEILGRLYSILEVPYQTLDDLLKDINIQ